MAFHTPPYLSLASLNICFSRLFCADSSSLAFSTLISAMLLKLMKGNPNSVMTGWFHIAVVFLAPNPSGITSVEPTLDVFLDWVARPPNLSRSSGLDSSERYPSWRFAVPSKPAMTRSAIGPPFVRALNSFGCSSGSDRTTSAYDLASSACSVDIALASIAEYTFSYLVRGSSGSSGMSGPSSAGACTCVLGAAAGCGSGLGSGSLLTIGVGSATGSGVDAGVVPCGSASTESLPSIVVSFGISSSDASDACWFAGSSVAGAGASPCALSSPSSSVDSFGSLADSSAFSCARIAAFELVRGFGISSAGRSSLTGSSSTGSSSLIGSSSADVSAVSCFFSDWITSAFAMERSFAFWNAASFLLNILLYSSLNLDSDAPGSAMRESIFSRRSPVWSESMLLIAYTILSAFSF